MYRRIARIRNSSNLFGVTDGMGRPSPQSLDLADDRPPLGVQPRMASSRIILLVVDPLKLAPGSSMDCNRLRRKHHVPENELFETEVLVW